jgi:hypothetical protein
MEEVGLSVDAVRRSIAIERLGPVPPARPGDRIVGPAQVYADAQVDAPAGDALARVDAWLVDGHHLRRDALRPGHGEWSKRSGVVSVTVRTIRHATGEGKLSDVERINAAARDTGNGSSVLRITVDRTNGRSLAARGGAAVAVTGTTGVVVAAVAAAPIVLLLMPVAAVAGVGVALIGRRRARQAEREIRRLLDAVSAGADPTRLSVDVVRRATGKATAAGSSALRAVGRTTPRRRDSTRHDSIPLRSIRRTCLPRSAVVRGKPTARRPRRRDRQRTRRLPGVHDGIASIPESAVTW